MSERARNGLLRAGLHSKLGFGRGDGRAPGDRDAGFIEPLEARVLLAADLVVTSITNTNDEYNVGQLLQAKANIANVGSFLSNTGRFDLQFWLSRDGVSSKYRLIETDSVPNVLQGVPTSDSINFPGWKIPEDLPNGNYHVTVYLDTGNDVSEESESNNFGTSPSFKINKPDLVVTSVTDTNDDYSVGQLLQAKANIANVGSFLSNTGRFDLEFWLSRDGVSSKYRLIETASVLNVLQGVPTSDIINLPGWKIPTDIPEDDYHVTVYLDTGNDVAEESESNNFGTSPSFRISKPDLVVPDIPISGNIFSYNDLLTAVATIRNDGEGATLPQAPLGFDLSFYLGDVNATTDAERMRYDLQKAFVAGVTGGGSTTDNLNTLLLPTPQPGEYRVWAKADSGNAVAESNEGNNWGSSNVLTLQGARWENASGRVLGDTIREATPVYLAIYTDEVGNGTTIGVDIFEDDVIGNDFLESMTLEHVSSPGGQKWLARWVPYRTSDLVGGLGGDPEYFFEVQNKAHLPGLFDASSNLTVEPNPNEFGVLLKEHTTGTGVPIVLVHGNNSETKFDLYRWKPFLNWIEDHPANYAEFDVWLWKHDTSKAVGFNSADGSQADRLAEFIYDTLGVGVAGTQYEDTKVALVAHSQGGLVSRSFMNTFNDELGRMQGEDVSTLITISTPHHGSPFGTQDWVAVLWSDLVGANAAAELSFDKLREKQLATDPGDLNLAWDNLDGVVQGAHEAFLSGAYVLTPRDMNAVGSFDDPSVVYLDSIKSQFGTLAALNQNEAYFHKLMAIGAYDTSLADNVSAADFAAALVASGTLSEHESLEAVTSLMARMGGSQLGNGNPSNYIANDGLVPLQSALLLNLPATGLSIATLNAAESVTINEELIAQHVPGDVLYHIFSSADGIADHSDVLETTNQAYWGAISTQLRAMLETTLPIAAPVGMAEGALISRGVLNGRGYLDIKFSDEGGSTLDPASILDEGAEFLLSGPAAADVVFDTAPLRLEENVFRYAFTGAFAPGVASIEFIPGSFADDAGNLSAPQVSTFEVGVILIPIARSTAFTDSDGDEYRVTIKGPGTLNAVLLDPDEDGKGPIDQLFVEGATMKTKVIVTVKRAGGGDGAVAIGDVNVEGTLGTFLAKNSDLVFNGFLATGPVKQVSVRDVLQPDEMLANPAISIGGTNADTFSLSARNLADGFTLITDGVLKLLKADSIGSGSIFAEAVGKVQTKNGGLAADITSNTDIASIIVNGGDFTGSAVATDAIGKLLVKSSRGTGGNVTDAIITAAAIRTLNFAGNLQNSLVLAGAHLGADILLGGIDLNEDTFAPGEIKNASIKGNVVNSTIAAGLDPLNGILNDGDDFIIGGADSFVRKLAVKGSADADSFFAAGRFIQPPRIAGAKIADPTSDDRFLVS